jgi:acyl-CoA reductase-like NAD-dependent aldehyde dehydrogenase
MDKGRLCSLAIAALIGFLSISPVTTYAAETNTESVTQSENDVIQQDKKAFEEKIEKASEKWKTLSAKQKEAIYSLMEDEMKAESKLVDKLAELEVLQKEDAKSMKTHMQERFKKLKESGDFPFLRQKHNNCK